jgi:hypothetical protein
LLNRRFGSLAEATSVFGKIVPPAGGDIPAQCRKSCGK